MRARRRGARSAPVAPPLALESLLQLAEGRIGLDLEIKEGRVVPALLDAVAGWAGPLVLTSFYPAVVRAVRERAPWIETGLIAGPMHIGDPLANARACGAHKLVLSDLRLNARLLEAASMPIWVWTVNQPARIARWLAEPIVECVITDDPTTAVAIRSALS